MKLDLYKRLKAEYVSPKAARSICRNPRRVAPPKLRTILRQPVRPR